MGNGNDVQLIMAHRSAPAADAEFLSGYLTKFTPKTDQTVWVEQYSNRHCERHFGLFLQLSLTNHDFVFHLGDLSKDRCRYLIVKNNNTIVYFRELCFPPIRLGTLSRTAQPDKGAQRHLSIVIIRAQNPRVHSIQSALELVTRLSPRLF